MQPAQLSNSVRFGPFRLDLRAGELHKDDRKVRLQEQPFRVLKMLVERPGEVVTREELQKKLWPNDTIVEFDHSINAAIKRLRDALGDSAEKPKYVETVARRGYRLLVPVDVDVGAGFAPPSPGDAPVVLTRAPQGVPLQMPNLLGKQVSHYRVLEVLGGGGMGVVYKAEDIKLGRMVALKFLPEELANDRSALERFEQEARAASALNHPNICTVYEFGEHEGQPFIAMELLEGQTLRERIARPLTPSSSPQRRGPFDRLRALSEVEACPDVVGTGEGAGGVPIPIDELLDLAVQIADGLGAAHQKGITHRDIKPANIFLATREQAPQVKILDFGLAKMRGSGVGVQGLGVNAPPPGPQSPNPDTPTASVREPHLTKTGVAMGTACYMSPEQVRGEKLDARTDLFSFGLVLYEMATGQQAFKGETTAVVRDAILNMAPAPARELNPEVPLRLEETINKAIEKDRDLRYRHASEIRSDLKRLKRDTESGRAVAVGLSRHPERGSIKPRLRRWLVAAALVVIAAAAGTYLYLGRRKSRRITDQDTVVLADFTNQTGDPAFGDALKFGLEVTLRQSPFLNLLSDDQVAATLRLMQRPTGTALTGDVAREVCQRAGSRAYIAGSIAALGSHYVLGLKAVGCAGGETLAEEQATGAGKEDVPNALDQVAAKLREELGESLASVQKFGTPLERATTSSFEALKACSLGVKTRKEKGYLAAVPFFHRAIEIDPTFAFAYVALGVQSEYVGQTVLAREYITRASALRGRTDEWEKLDITAQYYRFVTGELAKADQTWEEWIESYPRDELPYGNLAEDRATEGEYAAAVELNRQALRLEPNSVGTYQNLGAYLTALGRLDEARKTFEEALSRKLYNDNLRMDLYGLAFLAGDTQGMARQASGFERQPGRHEILSGEADTQAYGGELARARELTRRAVEAAVQTDNPEAAALWRVDAALREAAFGNVAEARRETEAALKLAPDSRDAEAQAALANAWSGDEGGARKLASGLKKQFPLDTLLNDYWLPTIDARMELAKSNPAGALDRLQAVSSPLELGFPVEIVDISCLYPVYTRGESYLAAGQGSAAAGEFQKILDHAGIVRNCATGALARLGLARAYALEGGACPARGDPRVAPKP